MINGICLREVTNVDAKNDKTKTSCLHCNSRLHFRLTGVSWKTGLCPSTCPAHHIQDFSATWMVFLYILEAGKLSSTRPSSGAGVKCRHRDQSAFFFCSFSTTFPFLSDSVSRCWGAHRISRCWRMLGRADDETPGGQMVRRQGDQRTRGSKIQRFPAGRTRGRAFPPLETIPPLALLSPCCQSRECLKLHLRSFHTEFAYQSERRLSDLSFCMLSLLRSSLSYVKKAIRVVSVYFKQNGC